MPCVPPTTATPAPAPAPIHSQAATPMRRGKVDSLEIISCNLSCQQSRSIQQNATSLPWQRIRNTLQVRGNRGILDWVNVAIGYVYYMVYIYFVYNCLFIQQIMHNSSSYNWSIDFSYSSLFPTFEYFENLIYQTCQCLYIPDIFNLWFKQKFIFLIIL